MTAAKPGRWVATASLAVFLLAGCGATTKTVTVTTSAAPASTTTSTNLADLFTHLHLFQHGPTALLPAEKAVAEHPGSARAWRALATAYESEGKTAPAVAALVRYLRFRPVDAHGWAELGGLQLAVGQALVARWSALQPAKPGKALPGGMTTYPATTMTTKANPVVLSALERSIRATYAAAVRSYQHVARLEPRDADAQFQLAQAAETAGNDPVTIAAYKAYLHLRPNSSVASQVRKLIASLQHP